LPQQEAGNPRDAPEREGSALLRCIRLFNLHPMIQIRSLKRLPFFAVLWGLTLLTREPGPADLRLGQRVYIDDGTCPQGQVKEVVGTPSGIERARKCVPRNTIK
jgi:hypothetical protein